MSCIASGIDRKSITEVPGTTFEDRKAVMDVNVTAAVLVACAVLHAIIGAGSGCILFASSIAGIQPLAQQATYSVSTAGLIQSARAIAVDNASGAFAPTACAPTTLRP